MDSITEDPSKTLSQRGLGGVGEVGPCGPGSLASPQPRLPPPSCVPGGRGEASRTLPVPQNHPPIPGGSELPGNPPIFWPPQPLCVLGVVRAPGPYPCSGSPLQRVRASRDHPRLPSATPIPRGGEGSPWTLLSAAEPPPHLPGLRRQDHHLSFPARQRCVSRSGG